MIDLYVYNNCLIAIGHSKSEICQAISSVIKSMEFVLKSCVSKADYNDGFSRLEFKEMKKGESAIYEHFKETFLYFKGFYPRTFNLNIYDEDFKEITENEISE